MADRTALIREAQKLLSKGQLDKAIMVWERLVQESPDGNTFNMMGDLYYKKGDKKKAIESFHQAAQFFRDEGFSLKALALFKKLLNINPSDPDALSSLGQLSEEKGILTDAIKYYLAAADALSKEGKKDRLLGIYEKILSLSPSNVPLRNKVAEIFLKEGLITDAVREYNYLARTYRDRGEFQNAMEQYRKVLSISSSNRDALLGLGHLLKESGETKNALEHLQKAVSLLRGDSDVLMSYAELLLQENNDEEAGSVLQEILAHEPDNILARRLLGDTHLRAGLRDEAWAVYRPVIDQVCSEESHDMARELLESFRECDPPGISRKLISLHRKFQDDAHLADELVVLGDTFSENGMYDDAVRCYREVLEIRPDDEMVKAKIAGLEPEPEEAPVEEDEAAAGQRGKEDEVITIRAAHEKTVEEALIEADIFSRYGLLGEAIQLLEGLKIREPRNVDLHVKLKSLYIEAADAESAVTECLVLSELYKRQGDLENSEQMLKDAHALFPADPRLTERGLPAPEKELISPVAPEAYRTPVIEDYEEDITEADFYARQGLTQEALKILEKLQRLFPENEDIREKITTLGHTADLPVSGDEEAVATEEPAAAVEGAARTDEITGGEGMPEPPGKVQYEDILLTDQDLLEAQEMPEPALDSDVLDIFEEFKRGLEKELGEEDSETHYNLGIAYKEMGLLDDAIKEFQVSKADPKRFLQSSTMLGVCYLEKKLFSLAIDVLSEALKQISDTEESHWAVKYDLAEAYEKNGDLAKALELYTEVYGWNARFRSVAEKVSALKSQGVERGEEEKPKAKKDRVSYL